MKRVSENEVLLNKLFDKLEKAKEYSPIYCYEVKMANQIIRSFFEEELKGKLIKSDECTDEPINLKASADDPNAPWNYRTNTERE